jgi:hypothetical protein
MADGIFGILFYKNGSNRGKIKMFQLERHDSTLMVGNGLQYWRWMLLEDVMELGNCEEYVIELGNWEIMDFVVLLQSKGHWRGRGVHYCYKGMVPGVVRAL